MNKVKLDCPVCETHNLGYEEGTKQCQHCGYCTTAIYEGVTTESEDYMALQDDIKVFVKFIDNFMWIPSQVQMPNGQIIPVNNDGKLEYKVILNGEDKFQGKFFDEAIGYIIQAHYGS